MSTSTNALDIKAMKAVMLFNDGWSMNMSMSKAGFTSTWNGQAEVANHPLIKTLKAINKDNHKKKQSLMGSFQVSTRI